MPSRPRCLGFTDTYPQQLYSPDRGADRHARVQPVRRCARLRLHPDGVPEQVSCTTTRSTSTPTATTTGPPVGRPNVDSAFLQDPGTGQCNTFSRTWSGPARSSRPPTGTVYNLVIMSTCYLGSGSSTMPGAFQIEKTKTIDASASSTSATSTRPTTARASVREGVLELRQRRRRLTRGRSARHSPMPRASAGTRPSVPANPFQANWWGNPNYDGTPTRRWSR